MKRNACYLFREPCRTLPQLREGAEWPEFHGLGNDTVEIALDGFSLAASTRAEQCRQIRPHILY